VSQNCDGLFRKTGLSPDAISELHGNTNIEQCIECGKEYLRGTFLTLEFCFDVLQDFDATASYQFSCRDHRTGRVCVLCGGILVDSIINFGTFNFEDN
jgi:mono-ADP-ribosyltransferase sirtuin 6